jgi:hypothetical protein
LRFYELQIEKGLLVLRRDATYIFRREGGGDAQGEQGERRPLEIDHGAGFQKGKGGVDEEEKERQRWEFRRGPNPNSSLEGIDVVKTWCVQSGNSLAPQLLWFVLELLGSSVALPQICT